MHQVGGVGGVQRRANLLDDLHRQPRGHRPVAFEQCMQVGAFDDRHHQIQLAVDFTGVMDRDDVRFRQFGRHVGLTPEPIGVPRFRDQLGRQHLDRDVASHHGVVGLIHRAHAALADQFNQPVAPERDLIHGQPPQGMRCPNATNTALPFVSFGYGLVGAS